MTDTASPPPLLVLDTNVVLDWLFFADRRLRYRSQLPSVVGKFDEIASQAMRNRD